MKKNFKKLCKYYGIYHELKTENGVISHVGRWAVETNMLDAGVDKGQSERDG